MGIHGICCHPDPIVYNLLSLAMVLCHYQRPFHTAGFPDVQLMCPVAVIRIFVFRVTPFFHFLADMFRDPGIIPYKIQQPLGIIGMFLPYPFPGGIVPFRILPIHANHVCRKAVPVVDICFAVGHDAPDKPILQGLPGLFLHQPYEQLIFFRIVPFRFRYRDPVIRIISQADPEVIGLHLAVSGARRLEFTPVYSP